MTLRALLTGAGGMLGTEVAQVFADDALVALDHAALDVADRDAVMVAICETAPEVVLHCGAWTAVDACEGDPDRAFRVNALGTRHVAEAARRVGAHVIYLSTDYVFDGAKDEPYVEWDAVNPRSVYGRSKLGGEQELDPASAIVRTSWVFGVHGHNIVKTILRLADGDAPLAFVDDQIGSPTCAADLAVALRRLAVARLPGRFHVTNQGVASWHEVAQAVLSAAGHDPARVAAVKTADLDPPRPAPRPANSVLDNAALRLQGLPLLPHWRDALLRTVTTLRGG
jgi:dTDP-4-dehydrorhamnose reductase